MLSNPPRGRDTQLLLLKCVVSFSIAGQLLAHSRLIHSLIFQPVVQGKRSEDDTSEYEYLRSAWYQQRFGTETIFAPVIDFGMNLSCTEIVSMLATDANYSQNLPVRRNFASIRADRTDSTDLWFPLERRVGEDNLRIQRHHPDTFCTLPAANCIFSLQLFVVRRLLVMGPV